jgi:hypothetical protein
MTRNRDVRTGFLKTSFFASDRQCPVNILDANKGDLCFMGSLVFFATFSVDNVARNRNFCTGLIECTRAGGGHVKGS